MKNKTIFLGGIFLLILSTWMYIHAAGEEITACVTKSGTVRVIGEDFRRSDCNKNETLLSWNIQGPKGDKGDKGEQGEPGEPAQHGAGNIAFIFQDKLLKTDGTVWAAYHGNVPFTQLGSVDPCRVVNGVGNVPIPVGDIVDWNYNSLLDKNGNYWFIGIGNICAGWMNFGPLP